MKGIVFNILEEVVEKNHGAEAWDTLLEAANVSGAYTSLGSYPDAEMQALVMAASKHLGITPAELLHSFGRDAMPILKQRYPELFSTHPNSRSFILSVNSIIHPEVRKLYPGAMCPYFHMKENDDGTLDMTYSSERHLIDLAQGFVLGAANVFGDRVEVERFPPGSGKENMLRVKWL
ncbi:heme NO-binding domain-containing protein [Komagataeibacter oboediens]|uniref:heme NO-binding domain-containing protein n=1 Tax=Komagataeibacter oboediens TaxID=65958 RepID=UPI0023DCBE8B|nr:heme NO-binding domain-containing protein [Komagataeibacter oboediens]WEQ51786.1 heme NO-binding domain-containing protein [Komagataeibacter oboediens]